MSFCFFYLNGIEQINLGTSNIWFLEQRLCDVRLDDLLNWLFEKHFNYLRIFVMMLGSNEFVQKYFVLNIIWGFDFILFVKNSWWSLNLYWDALIGQYYEDNFLSYL